MTTPLDPMDGDQYVEQVRDGFSVEDLDNIYNVTTCRDDYENPTTYEVLRWKSVNSCAWDSDEVIEN